MRFYLFPSTLTLLLCLLISTVAVAGGEIGNGGLAYVCREKIENGKPSGQIISAMIYDQYEGPRRYDDSIFTIADRTELSVPEQVRAAIERLKEAGLIKEYEMLRNKVNELSNAKIKPVKKLPFNYDDKSILLPEDPRCSLEQLAVVTRKNEFFRVEPIYTMFSNTSRAMTLTHEAINLLMDPDFKEKDLTDSRFLNALLYSEPKNLSLIRVLSSSFLKTREIKVQSVALKDPTSTEKKPTFPLIKTPIFGERIPGNYVGSKQTRPGEPINNEFSNYGYGFFGSLFGGAAYQNSTFNAVNGNNHSTASSTKVTPAFKGQVAAIASMLFHMIGISGNADAEVLPHSETPILNLRGVVRGNLAVFGIGFLVEASKFEKIQANYSAMTYEVVAPVVINDKSFVVVALGFSGSDAPGSATFEINGKSYSFDNNTSGYLPAQNNHKYFNALYKNAEWFVNFQLNKFSSSMKPASDYGDGKKEFDSTSAKISLTRTLGLLVHNDAITLDASHQRFNFKYAAPRSNPQEENAYDLTVTKASVYYGFVW